MASMVVTWCTSGFLRSVNYRLMCQKARLYGVIQGILFSPNIRSDFSTCWFTVLQRQTLSQSINQSINQSWCFVPVSWERDVMHQHYRMGIWHLRSVSSSSCCQMLSAGCPLSSSKSWLWLTIQSAVSKNHANQISSAWRQKGLTGYCFK